jgi:hypothetical protein
VPPPYRPCSSCHLAPARRERESEYRGEKLEKRKDRRRESESERRVWEKVTELTSQSSYIGLQKI